MELSTQRRRRRRSLRRPRPCSGGRDSACAGGVAILVASSSLWLFTRAAQAAPLFLHYSHNDHHQQHYDRHLADALAGVDIKAILQEIGQVDCPAAVHQTIKTFVDVNRQLFSACTDDSGYKLYPHGTKLPDADETSKICASPSCMDLMSGLVLAKLPECEYQRYSPRSMAESFLRVRVDLANNRRAPSASEFGDLYALNRVVNYLTENTTIQASVKTPFRASEVAADMNQVEINPDVVLSETMGVFVNETRASNGSSNPAAATTPTTVNSSTNDSTPATVSPPALPKSGSNTPSSTDGTSGATGSAGDKELPDNLAWAYLYVGLFWLAVNVVYLWFMAHKSH